MANNVFWLSIRADGAAFEEHVGHAEIARLLRKIADEVERGWSNGPVIDANGNIVGEYTW